jgi:hypothetical protein
MNIIEKCKFCGESFSYSYETRVNGFALVGDICCQKEICLTKFAYQDCPLFAQEYISSKELGHE